MTVGEIPTTEEQVRKLEYTSRLPCDTAKSYIYIYTNIIEELDYLVQDI